MTSPPRAIELWEPEALFAPGAEGALRHVTPVPSLLVATLLRFGTESRIATGPGRGVEVAQYELPRFKRVWARLEYHPERGRPDYTDLPMVLASCHIAQRERGPAGDWVGASVRRLLTVQGRSIGGWRTAATRATIGRLRSAVLTDAEVRPDGPPVGRDADGLPRGESRNHSVLHATIDEQHKDGLQIYDLMLGPTWLRDMARRPPVWLDHRAAHGLDDRGLAVYAALAYRAAAGHSFAAAHQWSLDQFAELLGYGPEIRPARKFEAAETLLQALCEADILAGATLIPPRRGKGGPAPVITMQPGPRLLVSELLAPFGVLSDALQGVAFHLAAFQLAPTAARQLWQLDREAVLKVLAWYHYLLQRGPEGKAKWPTFWNHYLQQAIAKKFRFTTAEFLAWESKLIGRASTGEAGRATPTLWRHPAYQRAPLPVPAGAVVVGRTAAVPTAPSPLVVGTPRQLAFVEQVAAVIRRDAPIMGLGSALLEQENILAFLGDGVVRLRAVGRIGALLAALPAEGERQHVLGFIRQGIATVLGIPPEAVTLQVDRVPTLLSPT